MYNIKYENFDFQRPEYLANIKLLQDIIPDIIKQSTSDSYYKILKPVDPKRQIEPYIQVVDEIRNNFSDVVVIGMGGAILNPKSVISLTNTKQSNPQIHFLDNTDPYYFKDLLSKIDLNKTAILAISNSGNTLETITLTGVMIAVMQKAGLNKLQDRFFFITNKQNGKLKDIAVKINGRIIEHEQGISGRYSGLGNVSILPAMITGIDVYQYCRGMNEVLDDFYKNKEHSKPAKAAISLFSSNKNICVNLGYLQNFDPFLEWYSQIIAESLGKNSRGYTPVKGLGPNDQHSMLQLYLDGPDDKIFTLFYSNKAGDELTDLQISDIIESEHIKQKSLAEINTVNFNATIQALQARNLPIRSFILDDLSAKSVGGLICHSMIEIILIGKMMGINPFNQPGVELIKSAATNLLKRD